MKQNKQQLIEHLLKGSMIFTLLSFFYYLYRLFQNSNPALDISSILAMITLAFLSVAVLLPKVVYENAYTILFVLYFVISSLMLLFPVPFLSRTDSLSLVIYGVFWFFCGFIILFVLTFQKTSE